MSVRDPVHITCALISGQVMVARQSLSYQLARGLDNEFGGMVMMHKGIEIGRSRIPSGAKISGTLQASKRNTP